MPRVGNPVDRFREAMALHRAGAVEQAEEIYREILREDSEHPGAWHLLGVVLHSQRDLAGALEHIQKALSLCDFKAIYWNNCGAVLKDLGRHQEAMEAFERAISIRDEYPDAWSNLGLMQMVLGQLDEADKSIRYALRLEPRHADALGHLAVVDREKGEFDEALRLCRDAAPVNATRYETEGSIWGGLRRFEEAVDACEKALSCNPDAVDTHLNQGFAYIDLDETEKAREAYRRVATLRPDRPMWYLRHLSLWPIMLQTADETTEYRAELERQLDETLADPPPFDWRRALQDLIVSSEQEYVNLAVRLGRDADFRQDMQTEILNRCDVLYEDTRVVHSYESLMEQTVQLT